MKNEFISRKKKFSRHGGIHGFTDDTGKANV